MCVGFLALAPCGALAAPSLVQAQSEVAPVGVQVIAVRATREGTVDPRLRAMEREMRSRGFGGFTLAGSEKKTLAVGKAKHFELSGRYTTEIRLIRRTLSRATLRIAVHKDGVLQHKADVTMPGNQGYITVVKPEGSRPALVVAITPMI